MGLNKQKLYNAIEEHGLLHPKTIIASEELDHEVLQEMIKDPIVENIYLKQVITDKDCTIKNLQQRIMELSTLAVEKYEKGSSAKTAINMSVQIAISEGILSEN